MLFLILILSCTRSAGQAKQNLRQQIDSLRLLSSVAGNDTLQLRHFTNMARLYRFVDVDSSKYFLKQAIESHKAKKVDNRKHAFAYNVIADIYRVEQKTDSALIYFEEAYQLFLGGEDSKPYLAIAPPYGNLLIKNKEVDKGVKIIQKAIQVAIDNKDNHNLSFLYANFGNVLYEIQDDKTKAKAIFEKGIITSKEIKNRNHFVRVNIGFNLGLAKIQLDEGRADSTIFYAKKALDLAREVQYTQKALFSCNLLSQSYIQLNKFEKARRYNEEGFAIIPEIQNVKAIIETKILKLAILEHNKGYNQIIEQGNQILNNYAKSLDDRQKEKIFNQLFEAYMMVGNQPKMIMSKDSLLFYTHQNYNEKHGAVLAKMYDETMVMEQKAENKLLLLQQEESEKHLAMQKIALLAFFLTSLFALAWSITAYRLYKQKKKVSLYLEKVVIARTKELQEVNDDLIQANHELRTLTHIASHDIKEPMRIIGGFVSLIRRKLPKELRYELEENFFFIDKSIHQLYTLIEDITKYINFSKTDVIDFEKIDLEGVIERIREDLCIEEKYNNSQIEEVNLKPISTNYSAIYFILKNIIENGLKYNDSTSPTVTVAQRETQNKIQISVSDNGLGIPIEFQGKIFDMHQRLHNRDKYEGSGLGLSIAKVLMKKLNGEISLESQPNEGSTFTISLPKLKEQNEKNKLHEKAVHQI